MTTTLLARGLGHHSAIAVLTPTGKKLTKGRFFATNRGVVDVLGPPVPKAIASPYRLFSSLPVVSFVMRNCILPEPTFRVALVCRLGSFKPVH